MNTHTGAVRAPRHQERQPVINEKRIEQWEISRLKKHARQDEQYRPMAGRKLARLADRIKRKGLDHPIKVLPDGTIVDGHQRVAAVTLLGWDKIKVEVGEDLAGDPIETERSMLESNCDRKQLSTLGEVGAPRRQLELQRMLPLACSSRSSRPRTGPTGRGDRAGSRPTRRR